jgi:predicted metal-binding membrane protein
MLSPRVDNSRYFLPALLALVAGAWIALILWGQSPYGRFLRHDELNQVSLAPNLELAGVMSFFVVAWTVMTIAMMLPTSFPLVTMFRRMVRDRSNSGRLLVFLVAGYIVVWSIFGLLAHLADAGLHASVQRWAWLSDNAWTFGGGTLLVAGVYQFTPLKYMCLDKCRSPLMFITQHWHGGRESTSAFRLGVHHGLFCVGCCWSLMLLMFAIGTGNVAWMLGLGAVMAIEKNAAWGRRLTIPLGVALIASTGVVLIMSGPTACAHTFSQCGP